MTEQNAAKQVWTTPSLETLEMKETAKPYVDKESTEFGGES